MNNEQSNNKECRDKSLYHNRTLAVTEAYASIL